VVSREPLIIYVENFLSPEESQHLLDIRYLPSTSPPLLFPTFPPWALSMRETRD
jgi:hypothetical protein